MKEEVIGRRWELFDVYFRTYKLRRIRWAERTAWMRGENCVQIFSRKNKEPKFQILSFNFYTKSDGLV